MSKMRFKTSKNRIFDQKMIEALKSIIFFELTFVTNIEFMSNLFIIDFQFLRLNQLVMFFVNLIKVVVDAEFMPFESIDSIKVVVNVEFMLFESINSIKVVINVEFILFESIDVEVICV